MCYQKRLKMIPEYELNQAASSQESPGTVVNSQQNDAHSHGIPVDETMITSTDDALSVLSIVRDLSSSSGTLKRQEIVLDGTRPVRDLFEEVGRRFGFEPDSFNLLLQRRSEGLVVHLDQHLDQTLENTGFALSLESRNQVQIEDKAGKPPRPSDTAGSAQGANLSLNLNTSNQLPMITAGPSSYPSYSRQSSAPGFVGLVNQAMTCYLNSLLQTLYMTPEFRNALYQWKFDGTPDEAVKSIPFQLQKLFLLLQTSKKSAVETTELTRSFGWDSSEAWQQHDIQELCRVMFDALEHKFKGTEHADLISRLYEGKMIDYVKCLECGLEKAREDTFLDVPLPVRPFGSMVAFSSIEESLKAFVQPETLDGNNQYHCEKCAKKCDAHKGLKFSKFPYLLTLHLKRFDFDYSTLQRIKLNDRVTFPELLELNSFLKDARESAADTEDCLSECTDLDDDASHRTHSSKLSDIESQIGEDDEGIDVTTSSSDPERLKRRALESGPYAYELFSIMIHSGSASGGHYYAYVKDFRTGAWNCFNDQTVTRLTPEDIEKSYGGSSNRSYYSSAYSSSTNAYMLIYRQVDRTRNTEPISAEQFPPHIKALITELVQQDEAERSVKERERSHFRIKLFCNHPQKGKIEVPWYVAKDLKLKEALPLAYDKLSLADVLPVEQCRLVTYSEFHDSLESSLEGKEDETLYYLLTAFGSVKYDLLMELDKEGRGFSVYSSAGCTVKIFRVNAEDSAITGPVNTHFSFATTVQELRESVAKLCNAKTDSINVLWESSAHLFTHLSDSDKSLKQEGFGRSNKVYVETSGEQFDIVRQVIEDVNNRTVMHVSVPPITQEMLDRDSIPTLAEYHTATSVATYNLVRETAACSGAQEYYSSEALSLNRWAMKEGEGTSDEEIGNVSIGSTSPQPASPLNTDDCDLIDVDQDLSSDRRFEAGDHSASEDSSLTDSDRTLMGDPPEECLPRVPSPQLPSPSDHHLHIDQVDSRKVDDASHVLHLVVPRFFRVDEITKENNDKVYKLTVDRRMHLGELKRHIEPYVNIPCDFFRVFKVQASSGIDRECVNLNETLETIGEEPWLTVRLGRALKPGEIRGKVYHLQPNEAEPVSGSFLFEWILAPGTSVRQVRQELWKESQKHGIDVPLERFSVRKKSWRSPGKVFSDHETVGDENIPLYANWELFIQILPEDREARCVPEGCREDCVVTLFLRRWRPSEFVLESFREVTFGSYESGPIKSKISELYGIPLESVQIAKPPGVFPCDMSILRIEADLDWERNPRSIEDQPYSILEDGGVLFWRDNRETLKELTEDERKAITIRENARLQRSNTYTASPSSRKEKALKIYYDPVVPSLTDVSVD